MILNLLFSKYSTPKLYTVTYGNLSITTNLQLVTMVMHVLQQITLPINLVVWPVTSNKYLDKIIRYYIRVLGYIV